MSSPLLFRNLPPRTMDLLADRALDGLSCVEKAELLGTLAREGMADDWSFDLTAAELQLCSVHSDTDSPIPSDIKSRLQAVGEAWCIERRAETVTTPNNQTDRNITTRRTNIPAWQAWGGWALAACTLLGSFIMLSSRDNREQIQNSNFRQSSDVFTCDWTDWDSPEVPGVKGSVTWSDSSQTGEMVFKGLPINDVSKYQYQLWIIDERGLSQRISGAIFDSTGDETRVRVQPLIAVRNAAAFAITIENPGGAWVSDMSRRVVIAKKT